MERLIALLGPTWIEVNLDNIVHNYGVVRRLVGEHVDIMAVVKADAYGHGAVEVARALVSAGCSRFGVFSLQEASELRHAGIGVPILVLSSPLPEQVSLAAELGVEVALSSPGLAERLGRAAGEEPVKVHIEVDTGMNRFGAPPETVPDLVEAMVRLPGISVAGVFTHFVETDPRQNARQLDKFLTVLALLEQKGLRPPVAHAANSAAVLYLPEAYLDMVRVGNLLYGIVPGAGSGAECPAPDVRSAWQLKTTVLQLRDVAPGDSIGYGKDFVATRPMRVAVLPLGLADGFMWQATRPITRPRDVVRRVLAAGMQGWRALTRGNGVYVHGHLTRLVGRVGMQHCVIDVSDLPDVRVGDVITVNLSRIMASPRIPRLYIEGGRPARVSLPLERRTVTL